MVASGYPGGLASPESLAVLLAALLLDAVVGDMPALFRLVPHPVRLVGAMVDGLERRLNRPKRSEATRRARGVLLVLLVLVLAIGAGWLLGALSRAHPYGLALELFLVTALIAQRSLFDRARDVARALERDDLAAARAAVRHLVGRDLDRLDSHGIARAAIESVAENFSDAVVGPVFWYLLGGLPGLFAYKAVNTMDSMIGHRSRRFRAFGRAAARLDDLMNLIPARLAGPLLVLAALFTPTARPLRALRVMGRDAGKHASPNAGWPEAAMAGALGLALAGPRRYGEVVVDDPWLGPEGTARARPGDIRRALALFVVACLVQFGLLAALAAGRGQLGL